MTDKLTAEVLDELERLKKAMLEYDSPEAYAYLMKLDKAAPALIEAARDNRRWQDFFGVDAPKAVAYWAGVLKESYQQKLKHAEAVGRQDSLRTERDEWKEKAGDANVAMLKARAERDQWEDNARAMSTRAAAYTIQIEKLEAERTAYLKGMEENADTISKLASSMRALRTDHDRLLKTLQAIKQEANETEDARDFCLNVQEGLKDL